MPPNCAELHTYQEFTPGLRLWVVSQFPAGFIAGAMNVCLKARDSLTNRWTLILPVGQFFKLTHDPSAYLKANVGIKPVRLALMDVRPEAPLFQRR
jgi:hypothetical protein